MASDKPESVKKWRHGTGSPVTVTASRFAELVLEHGLRVTGPDSDGYKYCALENEDGYDLIQCPDVDWDKIPIITKTGANPAAEVAPTEANSQVTVGAGQRFRPLAATVTLVASADAANRTIELFIHDGTAVIYRSPVGVTITATQTKTQTWCRMSLITAVGTQYGMHFPDIEMQPGWKMYPYITNFDTVAAGDDVSALTVYGQEAPL